MSTSQYLHRIIRLRFFCYCNVAEKKVFNFRFDHFFIIEIFQLLILCWVKTDKVWLPEFHGTVAVQPPCN